MFSVKSGRCSRANPLALPLEQLISGYKGELKYGTDQEAAENTYINVATEPITVILPNGG